MCLSLGLWVGGWLAGAVCATNSFHITITCEISNRSNVTTLTTLRHNNIASAEDKRHSMGTSMENIKERSFLGVI